LAVSRSPGNEFQRLLPRKLPLKPVESAAIYHPFETLSEAFYFQILTHKIFVFMWFDKLSFEIF
jgi:hypothetical protein